jgi:hypothetical protein
MLVLVAEEGGDFMVYVKRNGRYILNQ